MNTETVEIILNAIVLMLAVAIVWMLAVAGAVMAVVACARRWRKGSK
jgi:hypothetical protein